MKRTTIPHVPLLLLSLLPLHSILSEVMVRRNDRRMETDGGESDGVHRSLCDVLVLLVSFPLNPVSREKEKDRGRERDGEGERQTGGGGGGHYSMGSWFSGSALISLASLPSLLLLLFLCLCLR